MVTRLHRTVLGLLWLALVGCGDATGPRETFLGTIETDLPDLHPRSITVPRIVRSQTPFDVEVVTYFHRRCEEVGPTQVEVEGLRAVVVPFDQKSRGPEFCPDLTDFGIHRASVQFETSGTGTPIVRGWSDMARDTIEVEHDIVVRPR